MASLPAKFQAARSEDRLALWGDTHGGNSLGLSSVHRTQIWNTAGETERASSTWAECGIWKHSGVVFSGLFSLEVSE